MLPPLIVSTESKRIMDHLSLSFKVLNMEKFMLLNWHDRSTLHVISNIKHMSFKASNVTAVFSTLHVCPVALLKHPPSATVFFFFSVWPLAGTLIFSSCCSHYIRNDSENDFHTSQCLYHSFSLCLSLNLSIYLSRCKPHSIFSFRHACFDEIMSQWGGWSRVYSLYWLT